jgi:hypothetical protein
MYKQNQKRSKKTAKIVGSIAATIILVIGGGFAYTQLLQQGNNQPADDLGTDTINFDPPTEEERRAGDEIKDQIIQEEEQAQSNQNTDNNQRSSVTPLFGFLDQTSTKVQANGYVPVVESGGSCTLVLSRGSNRVSTTNPALPDAQSTVCGLMEIDKSRLSTGTWSATIEYSSPSSKGVSTPQTIEVQ